MLTKLIFTTALGFSICGFGQSSPEAENSSRSVAKEFTPKVIYGKDNRKDVYELGNSVWSIRASSTVALMKNDRLKRSGSFFDVLTNDFAKNYNLCASEPFRDQGTAAFCSGFLVGDDLIATAGHCIRTADDCADTSIVFEFTLHGHDDFPNHLLASNVYKCKSIVKTVMSASNGVDFAVIQVDRKVIDYPKAALRASGVAKAGDELVVIGHPIGLPTKVADGGIVRRVNPGYLVASLDTYGGNSGSAVFNSKTGDVEGILVRGETDFIFNGTCRRSKICDQDSCRGEDITRISHVLKVLNSL
jgi:S1-C subfamily serine protease